MARFLKSEKLAEPAPTPPINLGAGAQAASAFNAIALGVFVVSFALYIATLAPGLLWGGGDFAMFQTRIFTGELRGDVWGHPLWVIVARPFLWLPIRDVAYRANLSSAFFSALALVFVFRSMSYITPSVIAGLLATAALMVSHFFWLFAVTSKVYALSELMLAVCVYLLLRWRYSGRDAILFLFAFTYGLSLFNHFVLAIAAPAFAVFVLLVLRQRPTRSVRVLIFASVFFLLGLLPYALLAINSQTNLNAAGMLSGFVTGLWKTLTSPISLLLALGLGIVLWSYQYLINFFVGAIGANKLWRRDPALSWLFALIAIGNFLFLFAVGDPRSGADYVWNLQYYFPLYIVSAFWITSGYDQLASRRILTMAGLTLLVPIAVYALAPIIARPIMANIPGFRQLAGRDNLTYVLSPWKQNETGARPFGETILNALPRDSVLFADYSIWSIINYLQVVEQARPDVTLIEMPGANAEQQLPIILAQQGKGELFLADANRYYDIDEISSRFNIIPTGAVYHLIPK